MMDFSFYKELLNGAKIIDINRTCDMVYFDFISEKGEKFYLHAQCFIRIYDHDNLIICSQDMLRRSVKLKKWQRFNWAKTGKTLFDDTVSENKEKMCSSKIIFAEINEKKDVALNLENNIRLELFTQITTSDDPLYSEDYRFLCDNETIDHFVV